MAGELPPSVGPTTLDVGDEAAAQVGPPQVRSPEGPQRVDAASQPDDSARPGHAGPPPGIGTPRTGGPPGGSPAGGTPPSRRVRARLSRLARTAGTPPELERVLRGLRRSHPRADFSPVIRAYQAAEEAHRGQLRRSGEPYITHPVAVAEILTELGMDIPTICAALLHDVVEDTPVVLAAVRADFGELVAAVVDGVTKLDRVSYGDAAEAETIRKMVVAMARDPRVLVVKLADRLHNMRTLRYLPPEKQERIARQTLEIYAPLAHRLGMNTIKWELEDLAFATLYPKRYEEIVRLVAERAPSRDTALAEIVSIVTEQLHAARIRASVTGRPKHYYSIYQKMIVRGRDFAEIYDLVGIRVLVENVRDCYAALGVIHALWNPLPGRFKDYIAMPKFNMYQSLHTTVIGPGGKPVELQIRSQAMHRLAEYGIAAHWKYKETRGAVPERTEAATDMGWLRQILDWQREATDPTEFLDGLRFDLHRPEVFAFTPKGDVIALPAGATPVDFAYAVHTEVGHHCIGARVNGRLVPLETHLDNGDVVEIFTTRSAHAAPSQDWLSFVASSRARSKIRQWFARERREDALEAGRDALGRALRKRGLPLQRLLTGEALQSLAQELHYPDLSGLYAAIGEGHISATSVVGKLVAHLGGPDGSGEDLAESAVPTRPRPRPPGDPGVMVAGHSDVLVKLARCCTPVPPDAIVGFVTRGHGVSVHRAGCRSVADLGADNERFVDVSWAPGPTSVYTVAIQVEALDRTRLLSDVTRVLSDQHVNILSASVTTSSNRVAVSRFTFETGGPEHLDDVLAAVRAVGGVYDCYRVTNSG